MGGCCSTCFGERPKEVKFPIQQSDDDESVYTPESVKNIDIFHSENDPKRFLQKQSSNNQEDKLSDTKVSVEATLTNGKSASVHASEDSKKSSSSEHTNVFVGAALESEIFMPGLINADTSEIETIEIEIIEPNSNQHEIKTDMELIHQMLYSSDSSDSFENKEKK